MSVDHLHTRWDGLKQRLQHTTLAMQAASSRDSQRTGEIYRQRAALLATPRTPTDSSRNIMPALVFALGDQHFGIPLSQVVQVYPSCSLTPVPRTPSWVLGIANFESQIRSVIDLAKLLDLPADRPQAAGNILLVRCSAGTVTVRVDRVEDVQKISQDQLVAPDQQSNPSQLRLIRGVTPEHLAILSVDAIFAHTASPNSNPS